LLSTKGIERFADSVEEKQLFDVWEDDGCAAEQWCWGKRKKERVFGILIQQTKIKKAK